MDLLKTFLEFAQVAIIPLAVQCSSMRSDIRELCIRVKHLEDTLSRVTKITTTNEGEK